MCTHTHTLIFLCSTLYQTPKSIWARVCLRVNGSQNPKHWIEKSREKKESEGERGAQFLFCYVFTRLFHATSTSTILLKHRILSVPLLYSLSLSPSLSVCVSSSSFRYQDRHTQRLPIDVHLPANSTYTTIVYQLFYETDSVQVQYFHGETKQNTCTDEHTHTHTFHWKLFFFQELSLCVLTFSLYSNNVTPKCSHPY